MGNWFLNLIKIIWGSVSAPMREQIVQSVKEWEIKAKESETPYDDILVEIVKWLLAIP